MNHKEMVAHIRKRIKHEGIKARVKLADYCGVNWIHVDVATYGQSFDCEQARKIAIIADANKLTYAQGMPVDCSHQHWAQRPQGTHHFSFVFHG